jgi:methionine synthase II (cobalamin-independent)
LRIKTRLQLVFGQAASEKYIVQAIMSPPFRAEHIGSMLRPQPYLQARNDLAEKKLMSDTFNSIRDSAIVDIVKTQVNLGFRGVTDGEYSRDAFVGNFFVALEGYEYVDEPDISTLRTYGRFRGDYELMILNLHYANSSKHSS